MSQQPNHPPRLNIDPRLFFAMIGILLAPFVGLLYSAEAALVILIVCLGITCWMLLSAAAEVPPAYVRPLRIGAMVNGVFAGLALLLILVRILR